MRWLWLEKNCHYIVEQRSPRPWLGSPDILGVTAGRYLIEIEIKRSISDFFADSRKYHRLNRERTLDAQARQFYYMFPSDLADKVKDKIPIWAGLMCNSESMQTALVLTPAPINRDSGKLTIKQCVKMARCLVNHMMAVKLDCERWRSNANQLEYDPSIWAMDKTVGFYQI